jgi:hypothetical protein
VRRGILAAAAAVAALLAWVVTSALAGERPPELGRMAAAGAVTLADSDSSTAILHADGLRPGHSVSGSVTLGNVGESPGRLSLLRTRMVDVPGVGGGLLSRALALRVDELGGSSPRLAWSGALTGPEIIELGTLPAGAMRTYRLTLTMPDTGQPAGPLAGDNAFQGASVTIDWAWATESETPAATSTPTATATATPTPRPTPVPVVISGRAPRLKLRIPHQRVLATRGISMFGTCDQPCRVTFRALIKTAPRARNASRTLQRRRIFRSRGADRRLPGGVERRIALRLTRRAAKTLKKAIHRRGSVAVVIRARVRGVGGAARTVKRRIVLRRPRHRQR